MKKYAFLVAFLGLAVTAIAGNVQTSAIMSPKCDEAKIKSLAGDALKEIKKASWKGGYNVTLDTSKMTFSQLTQKMQKEGCY